MQQSNSYELTSVSLEKVLADYYIEELETNALYAILLSNPDFHGIDNFHVYFEFVPNYDKTSYPKVLLANLTRLQSDFFIQFPFDSGLKKNASDAYLSPTRIILTENKSSHFRFTDAFLTYRLSNQPSRYFTLTYGIVKSQSQMSYFVLNNFSNYTALSGSYKISFTSLTQGIRNL